MLPAFDAVWGNFLYVDHEGSCWHCDKPCHSIEINFEAWLHDGACAEAKWNEYDEANRQAGPIDLDFF